MKQETTLEEAAEQFIKKLDFNSLEIDDKIFEAIMFGAKWQQERSEEETIWALLLCSNKKFKNSLEVKEWFEQFKKK
jgi:hypothetical protein